MNILFLKHLKLQIIERNIPEELVKDTLLNPEIAIRGVPGTKVAQKIYFENIFFSIQQA